MHYIQGKLMTVADTLIWASPNDSSPETENTKIKCYVHAIESNYLISDYRLQQFQHETKTDESLQTLLVFTNIAMELFSKVQECYSQRNLEME